MKIDHRKVCREVIIRLANHNWPTVSLDYAYDYDTDFIHDVAEKCGWASHKPHLVLRRLQEAFRRLEAVGVLYGRVSACHREYIGEPPTLKAWRFAKEEYGWRIAPEKHPWYRPQYSVEFEIEYLLEKAFPSLLATQPKGRGGACIGSFKP